MSSPERGAKSRSGEAAGEGLLETYGVSEGSGSWLSSSMTITCAQGRELGQESGHPGRELPLVDEGHQVGVGEEVAQLVVDVAVVDVHPHGPQLEDGPQPSVTHSVLLRA
jgi:hypothetical protein